MTEKRSLDIEEVLSRLRQAVRPFPKAAMFALAEEGYTSAFEQLISCIISIRTYDEVSLPVSRSLFAVAKTPAGISNLSIEKIESLIAQSTYAKRKAAQIKAIALHSIVRKIALATQHNKKNQDCLLCNAKLSACYLIFA